MNSPIYNKVHELKQRYQEARQKDLYFYMRRLDSASEARITVRGKTMLMFGSNNYLGLTTHPKVKAAAQKALEQYGTGAGSVRLLGGTFALHEQLEECIADFKGTEAAIVFASGYVSNLSTLAALLDPSTDIAVIDERIHASLIDGLRLGGIPMRLFRHSDMADLERKLIHATKRANVLVVVDGVYSMDGDICPLPEIHALTQRYKALLLIDDAHSTGVLGKTGAGTAEHFGLKGKIDIVMGTLSKALGGLGGFAAGPRDLIYYLKHCSRGFIFSGALPPSTCAGLIAAIDVIRTEPQWLEQLRANTQRLRQGLREIGYAIDEVGTAIVPVILGDEIKAYELTRFLDRAGIYVSPVTFPAVRKGTDRIRMGVMATHTTENVDRVIEVMAQAWKKNIRPDPVLVS